MISKCHCIDGYLGNKVGSTYQDSKYGQGMRAFNPISKQDGYRCTICGNEITKGEAEKPKKGKGK